MSYIQITTFTMGEMDGWIPGAVGSAGAIATEGSGGAVTNYFFKGPGGGDNAFGYLLEKTFTGLEPGERYVFTMKVRVTAGAVTPDVNLAVEVDRVPLSPPPPTYRGQQWQQYMVVFIPAQATATISIRGVSPGDNAFASQSYELDDLGVQDAGPGQV